MSSTYSPYPIRTKTMLHRYRFQLACFLPLMFIGCILYRRLPPSQSTALDDMKFSADLSKADNGDKLLKLQISMLNDVQLDRLSKITSGTLTRRDVEIVIARWNEDISWSDMYKSVRTVYDKSSEAENLPASTSGKIVKLPNLGRESYTYLWHIVNNYDKLAKVTAFTQGSVPTHGYFGHRKGGGHLISNSTFHDFVLSETGHFVFSGVVWLPTAAHLLRSGYNKGILNRWQGMQKCPTPLLTDPTGSEYRFDLEDKNHLFLLKHIASRCTVEGSSTCSGSSFWAAFINLPRPKDDVVFFSQGAVFSATAEQIRRRPLSEYKRLLDTVSKSEDPSAGFFLEWMWYYVVTSDVSPCPLNGLEFEWAMVSPFYKTMEFPRRVEYTPERVKEATRKKRRGRINLFSILKGF